MRDRELLAWLLSAGGMAVILVLSAFLVFWPTERLETRVVFRDHPKGLHRLPQFDDTTVMGPLTRVCDVWANFTPSASLAFAEGQRYLTECRIVATPPKG